VETKFRRVISQESSSRETHLRQPRVRILTPQSNCIKNSIGFELSPGINGLDPVLNYLGYELANDLAENKEFYAPKCAEDASRASGLRECKE